MKTHLTRLLALASLISLLTACGGNTARDPYNDPDSQRDRSGDAQQEMRRSTSY